MRLSGAATAAVQLRSANAAILTLRIIAPSFAKHCCWKHRRRGDEDNEAGRAHRRDRRGSTAERARASPAAPPRVRKCGASRTWAQGWQPCCAPGAKRREPVGRGPPELASADASAGARELM